MGRFSEEGLRNIQEANKRRVWTPEMCAAISKANAGNQYAVGNKAGCTSFLGRTHTDVTKQQIRGIRLKQGNTMSDEARQLLSERCQGNTYALGKNLGNTFASDC